MVIDTSALLAIELHEPERRAIGRAIEMAAKRSMSAASAVEFIAVHAGRAPALDAVAVFDRLTSLFEIQIVPVDEAHWREAASALLRYGKGRHPARLNLGDSFAYSLAKVSNEPLLFKGRDFSQTDIAVAAY
ncbi:MAG TPA: type II toxin-antitoxin system VapC family toxin [Caulobacteraceae bacterium]|jgi:ribonuclease VapC